MLNIIKADLYRIFRGKGVYITLVIYLAFLIIQVAENQIAQSGVMVSVSSVEYDEYGNTVISDDYKPPESENFNGAKILFQMARATDNLIYFLLAFIVFAVASDFSSQTVKNMLAGGMSRTKYFFSKLTLSGILYIALFALYLIVSLVTATVLYGFGGAFNMQFIGEVAKVYLPQFYLIFAYNCIGVFLIFTFKRTAILNTVYIVFAFVPVMIIALLNTIDEKFWKLSEYDLLSNVKSFGIASEYYGADLKRSLILGTVYILATVIGGVTLFRKSEIK